MIIDPLGTATFGGTEDEARALLLALKWGCCHAQHKSPCDTGCVTMKLALDQHFLDAALFLRRVKLEAFSEDGVE